MSTRQLQVKTNQGSSGYAGYTLIELMVLVAILGTVTMLAVPNYLTWNAKSQLRQAASEIWSQLSLARVAAMNRNTTVSVALTFASGQVTVATTTAAGVPVLPPQTLRLGHITGGAVGGGGPIQFNSLGLKSSGGAGVQTVTVTNDKNLTYSIGIVPGGKATWCPKSSCP